MRTFIALAASITILATPALAQTGGAGDRFAAIDRNGDGAISRSEAEAARDALFERLDTNGDGYLSEAERTNGGRAARQLANGDANNDGRLSRAEVMALPYRMFDRFDANHDGVLSAEELAAVRARRNGG